MYGVMGVFLLCVFQPQAKKQPSKKYLLPPKPPFLLVSLLLCLYYYHTRVFFLQISFDVAIAAVVGDEGISNALTLLS